MLILGIDTSGKSGGITLAEGDAQSFRAVESCPILGGTFSAQLVPTIAALLERHGHDAQDLDGFAVASGPGSFTGLRVGLSAVKGLAEVLNKPIMTVSLLEALAVSSGHRGRIAAALDAGRSEIFWGVYQVSAEATAPISEKISEELLTREAFLERLGNSGLDHAVTGDPTLAIFTLGAPAKERIHAVVRPTSEMIARIGLQKLLAGETVSVEALDANYIRRSDAEIFSKGRR
ncbi:MAG TPA: tRNA (adenosine(37)-N6)-threonylcarbamoyltransferase complex dimerization subunit type 1 TsaB [Candidatus Angelobacter sp.]|nr:tRNA (adenosine(37)-N6)-threonylcarbamoyltransferase complex dimerization subunit type 1 TsaB [Candidatus Angelobacter sp.]